MKMGIIDAEINGLWQVCHDSGELTSAVTSYDITGLEGDTDIEYQIIARTISGTAAGGHGINFRLNNDSGSNYGYQQMVADNATPSASRGTAESAWSLGYMNGLGKVAYTKSHIFAKSGKERTQKETSLFDINGTTVWRIYDIAAVWNNTADEVTSINISSSLTDGIGVGSRYILLKKVHNGAMKTGEITPNKIEGAWERIYSNTLTANTTTVTISGLEGNTDQVYRLVYKEVSNYAGNLSGGLTFNSDTASNYGDQKLSGTDSTVAATRGVRTRILAPSNSGAVGELSMSDTLIYAKSGYERTGLMTRSDDIGGTTVDTINLFGGVWNNTSSEITSMEITSSQTNGLGIGTSIELYRLNL